MRAASARGRDPIAPRPLHPRAGKGPGSVPPKSRIARTASTGTTQSRARPRPPAPLAAAGATAQATGGRAAAAGHTARGT